MRATSSDAAEDPVDRALLRWLGSPSAQRDEVLDELCAELPDFAAVLRRRARHLVDAGLLDQAPTAQPIERLGPFRLQHMIGGGGMGLVYLARQEHLDRPVAIKLLRPEYQLFERSRERFRREIAAVSRLQHPGIVPVYHCGEEQNVLYLAMEHVAGTTLAELLQAMPHRSPERIRGADVLAIVARRAAPEPALRQLCRGPWPELCVRVAIAVARALQHAHERGVVHRDVKPSNVILADDGRVMLVDFGLAQASGVSRLTASGAQAGSLPYMAPEQVRGEATDARTDVYGLGVTLYELLTLAPPFWEDGHEALRQRILEAAPSPVRQRNRAVARDLEIVCHKAMDAAPAQRYRTAAAFAEDLEAVLAHRPIAARPTGAVRRAVRWCQRHPAAVAALAAIAAIGVGAPLLINLSLRAQRDDALQQAYSAHVVAAAYHLSIHNALGAKQQLQACLPAMRGFEWQHLERAADQSERHLPAFRGYFAAVHWAGDLLLHADENTGALAAIGPAGDVRWHRSLDAVRWTDVSRDAATFAVADGTATITRIDAATGTVLPPLTARSGEPVRWLQFLTDGGLAVASQTGAIAVLDDDGTPRSQLTGLPPACRAVTPGGDLALVADLDQLPRAELWDLRAGERLATLAAGRFVWSAAFGADGQHFALGSEDGVIETFTRGGERLARMKGHAGRTVNALRFLADGSLVSVGNDCSVQSWDPETGALLATRHGHEAIVLDLDVEPVSGRLATISPFDGIRVWAAERAPHAVVMRVADVGAEGLAWSADGRLLYAACQDGRLRVLDAGTHRAVREFDAGARLCGCAVRGDRLFGIGFHDERALVAWDLAAGERPHEFAVSGYQEIALAVEHRTGAVACGHGDGTIRVFDDAGHERARLAGLTARVTGLAWCEGGDALAAGDERGGLQLVDVRSGTRLATATARGPVLTLAVRADELWCGEGNHVVVRDGATLTERRVLSGHHGKVHDLAITPDGARVASASHDGTVRIWHPDRGDCLLVLPGSGDYVYAVAFDPTGTRLAAGCGNGAVYVWNGAPR